MASWPSGLPDDIVSERYSEQRNPGVVRTGMDAGPDFTRRRFSAVPVTLSITQWMTGAEVATLDAFFSSTLDEGASTFTWEHPRTGVASTMRFLGPPSIGDVRGDRYVVSFQLEVLP